MQFLIEQPGKSSLIKRLEGSERRTAWLSVCRAFQGEGKVSMQVLKKDFAWHEWGKKWPMSTDRCAGIPRIAVRWALCCVPGGSLV